jgi:hypothetical protein
MKTLLQWISLPVVVMLAVLMCVRCSDPEQEEPVPKQEEEEKEITTEEADAILNGFIFSNRTKKTGSVPSVANTSLVKTDMQDTLYALPGIKMPIRISHPESVVVGGWYVAINNSTFYYEVSIDEEEDSDTVSVVILEIDPEEMDLPSGGVEFPMNIPVEITPHDQGGQPIDVLTRVIAIEEQPGTCDIRMDGDTIGGAVSDWIWYSTTIFDSNGKLKFCNMPYRPFNATQKVVGCCADSTICPQAVYNPVTMATDLIYDSETTANTSYSIQGETLTFFKNGTFGRLTVEGIKNFSYTATDWCGGIAGYNDRQSVVEYYGTHDWVPGRTTISYHANRKRCDDPLGICGYGSRPGDIMYGCRILVIMVDRLMLEGTQEVRIYLRTNTLHRWGD